MNKLDFSKIFLLFLIIFVIYACYLIFKPFLVEILAAAILVSIFYTPYQWLVKKFKNKKNFAALIMCLLVILLVIIPLTNLIIYTAQKSVIAYSEIINFVNQKDLDKVIQTRFINNAYFWNIDNININSESLGMFITDIAKKVSNWLVSGATGLVKGTTNFIISLIFIIFSMFFFFVNGEKIVKKLMIWTPLPDRYDQKIFQQFRDVSFVTIISIFATAISQGIVGAIGFMIVGLPVFFPAIFIAFFSLIPYVGAFVIWFPAAIYLLIIGKIWQSVFLFIWGALFISTVDNFIKAYIIHGKVQVHPILIIFSILGGITLFGFWGIIFGPLIISLAATILHIYEEEI